MLQISPIRACTFKCAGVRDSGFPSCSKWGLVQNTPFPPSPHVPLPPPPPPFPLHSHSREHSRGWLQLPCHWRCFLARCGPLQGYAILCPSASDSQTEAEAGGTNFCQGILHPPFLHPHFLSSRCPGAAVGAVLEPPSPPLAPCTPSPPSAIMYHPLLSHIRNPNPKHNPWGYQPQSPTQPPPPWLGQYYAGPAQIQAKRVPFSGVAKVQGIAP